MAERARVRPRLFERTVTDAGRPVGRSYCWQAAQKDLDARRAVIVIVSVKREREIQASTTTRHEHEF